MAKNPLPVTRIKATQQSWIRHSSTTTEQQIDVAPASSGESNEVINHNAPTLSSETTTSSAYELYCCKTKESQYDYDHAPEALWKESKHDPKDLQRELDTVDEWLADAHKVPFGKGSRGLTEVRRKMKEMESAKRGGKPYNGPHREKAAKFLNKLIYRRHALLHGFWNVEEMTNIDRGKSLGFTDNNNNKKEMKTEEWKFIVWQQWKFGKSEYLDIMYLGKEPEEGSKTNLAKARKMKKTNGW